MLEQRALLSNTHDRNPNGMFHEIDLSWESNHFGKSFGVRLEIDYVVCYTANFEYLFRMVWIFFGNLSEFMRTPP